jgi:hypothetical protein
MLASAPRTPHLDRLYGHIDRRRNDTGRVRPSSTERHGHRGRPLSEAMLIPDLILLAVVLAVATWRLFAPAWRRGLRVGAVALGFLLAAAQWALCGFTWQDLPAYPLLALSALPPVRTVTVLRWLGRVGLVGITAAAIGVWILPAVPMLRTPTEDTPSRPRSIAGPTPRGTSRQRPIRPTGAA